MITLAHSVESTKPVVAHLTLFIKIAGNNNRLKYLCYFRFWFLATHKIKQIKGWGRE